MGSPKSAAELERDRIYSANDAQYGKAMTALSRPTLPAVAYAPPTALAVRSLGHAIAADARRLADGLDHMATDATIARVKGVLIPGIRAMLAELESEL